jgi:hypothetical protein
MFSSLPKLFNRARTAWSASRKQAPARQVPVKSQLKYVPRLDVLEDRVVPSASVSTNQVNCLSSQGLTDLSKVTDPEFAVVLVKNNGSVPVFLQSVTDPVLGNLISERTTPVFPVTQIAATITPAVGPVQTVNLAGDLQLDAGAVLTVTVTRIVQPSDPNPTKGTTTFVFNSDPQFTGATFQTAPTWTVNLFHPAVYVQVSVDKTSAMVGDTVSYLVTITNTSTSNSPKLINFNLTETVADPTPPVIPALAPGQVFQFSYSHVVTAGDPNPLTNTVRADFHVTPTGMHMCNNAFTNDVFNTSSAATGIFTQNKLFFFARSGDPSPATLTSVASALSHSPEYYGNRVTAAYQQYLGRLPAPPEVAAWVGALQNGLSDERMEAGFIGSPEYIQKHGGPGAGWITGMYQNLLGRTPSLAEVKAWLAALAGGQSPTDVAFGFAASPEREGQRITADYLTNLGRLPSAGEVASWVQAFHGGHGISNEDIIAGFVGSPEFFQGHKGDVSNWLISAYEDILHRRLDPAGYQGWLNVLTGA